MGFLSVNTKTVDLGEDYWAKVRELTADEYAPIEEILAQVGIAGEQMSAQINMATYRRALVAAALVDWNLTDEFDQPLPVTPQSVGRLPIGSFEQLHRAVTELNGTRRGRDAAQFRGSGDAGDQGRVTGASAAAEVPAGAGAVATAG